jgi:tetratricopeptide (TPR) repeat protein
VLARSELQEQRPVWGTTALDPVMVRLGLLTGGESVDLVRQAGGAGVDEAAASEIAARAGGNPFFIIETTGMFLPDGSGPSSSPVVIPPTVQAVISARIDALPERLRELARRAAAFLVSFDLDELAVADPSATVEDLRLLEDAEIVVREESGPGPSRWRLRHAMLKDVAYASLPKWERVRLHRSIAERLATAGHPSWASDHLELAAFASLDLDPTDRAVSDEAADALVESGHRARRRTESRSAIDYYERALAIAGPPARWGVRESRALAGMGEARYWLGEYPAATESLERAVALGTDLDDPFTLALALRFMGDIAINVEADLDRAEALLDRSLNAAEELGDPWAIARTLLFAGWVPWTRERYEDAGAIWRRALSMADPDDGWARVRALNCLSINLTGGPERLGPAALAANEEALRLSDEASALAEEIGDQFSIAMTAVQRARVLGDLGRREEAMPSFDRAVAIFDDLGARWEYADAIAERGIAKRELDRLDEAEEDLLEATRISEELGERQLASWVWRALARVAERRGDHAEAGARHRRSKDAEERLRVRFRRR